MADRIITWHFEGLTEGTQAQGPTFYMDRDYNPGACRIYARNAPTNGDLKLDLRNDGITFCTADYIRLSENEQLEENADDYANPETQLDAGTVVSLHIIETNGAAGITVELELNAVEE